MSQQSRPLLVIPVEAAGVITTRRFVGYDGNQASVQGQKVMGVAKFGADAAGEWVPITTKGTEIVETGAALNPGQSVISDNLGRAIPNTGALHATDGTLTIAAGATAVTSAAANGAGTIAGAPALAGSDLPEFIAGDVVAGQVATAAGQFIEVQLR